MIKLKNEDYPKIFRLLDVPEMNVLFAKSVVTGNVDGTVYVDDPIFPTAAYIKHPYGMSLLVGKADRHQFLTGLKSYLINDEGNRLSQEWLQVTPSTWLLHLEKLLGKALVKLPASHSIISDKSIDQKEKVHQYQRLLFTFDPTKFVRIKNQEFSENLIIRELGIEEFNSFGSHVAPKYFWNNAGDFFSKSKGFSLVLDDKTVAVAFGSFRIGDLLEIGVETGPRYRGQGYALLVCAELIRYCLKKKFTPIWSCHAGNMASKLLALKLGFEVEKILPYYHLL